MIIGPERSSRDPPDSRHQMSDGAQEASFTCPFCGRAFDGQEELTAHFEESHDMAGFA